MKKTIAIIFGLTLAVSAYTVSAQHHGSRVVQVGKTQKCADCLKIEAAQKAKKECKGTGCRKLGKGTPGAKALKCDRHGRGPALNARGKKATQSGNDKSGKNQSCCKQGKEKSCPSPGGGVCLKGQVKGRGATEPRWHKK